MLFSENLLFFKNANNLRISCRNQLKLSTEHKDINMYQKNVIKIGGDFGAIFWKKPLAIVQGIFQKLAHFF